MMRLSTLLFLFLSLSDCSPSTGPVSVVLPAEEVVVSPGDDVSLTCKVYQTVRTSLAVWRVEQQSRTAKSELRINKVRFDSRPYFSSVLNFTDLQRGDNTALYCYDKLVKVYVETVMIELEVVMTSDFSAEELVVVCKVAGSPPPSLSLSALTYNYSGDSAQLEPLISLPENTLNSSTTSWSFKKQELSVKVNLTCIAEQDTLTKKTVLNKTLSLGVPRNLTLAMSVSGAAVKSGSVVPVTVGKEVEIVCSAQSYPPPAVLALSHNNILLASDNTLSGRDELTVRYNFTASISDVYFCSTVPTGGCQGVGPCSSSVNFTLSLQVPVLSLIVLPDLNITLSTNSSTSTLDVRQGSHPYVKCVGSGIPPPIQVSLKIDDTYVSYNTSGQHHGNSLVTNINSLVTNSNSLVTNSNSLVTGRFVPVNSPTTVLCIAWQECHYDNCSQATRVVLNPTPERALMSPTKSALLFFTTFVGSFLSLITLFAIFLICVHCCSHDESTGTKKPADLCSPTASIKSVFGYFNSQKSAVKRRKTKRTSVKDIKFTPVFQETATSDKARDQARVSLFPEEISPDSKPSGHLSWDGTFETGLLDELDELVAQYTEFGTESLCSGCNDLRENCAGKSNSSLPSTRLNSEENLATFFSTCELNLNDDQRKFMSPAENDYESILGCESSLTFDEDVS
ncbi:hypothetical protein ACHWQZ_G008958 [Mnemiopsis leidyi]